jgi:hypothetical protein
MAGTVTAVTDVRGLVLESNADARARVRRRVVPATMLFTVLGVWVFTALPLAGRGAGAVGVAVGLGVWAFGMAAAGACVGLLRHPRRRSPVRGTLDEDGGRVSILRKPTGGFRASWTLLGGFALLVIAGVSVSLVDDPGPRELIAAPFGVAIALLLALPAVGALTGKAHAGELAFHDGGLRFHQSTVRVALAWDDVVAVHVDEPLAEVRLTLAPDSPTLADKRAKLRDGDLVLGLSEWGILPTDVARLILELANDRGFRRDAGDPAAISARLDSLRALPVHHRRASWTVGQDTGAEEDLRSDTDPEVPVRGKELTEEFSEAFRMRVIFVPGMAGILLAVFMLVLVGPGWWGAIAGLGVGTGAVALTTLAASSGQGRGGVGPPLAALTTGDGVVLRRGARRSTAAVVAGAGFACAVVAVTARFSETLPTLAVVAGAGVACGLLVPLAARIAGRWYVGELVLDNHALTYRSGTSTASVPWAQLVRADAMWGSVVRVERRDGPPLRIDVRAMATDSSAVVTLLNECARHGRAPDLRDVSALHHRLTRRRVV